MVKKHLKAENTDIRRTIKHERKRFIAIAVITMLGVMMFSGLQASCHDLLKSADTFFDEQHLHDLSVQSTLGLTDDDVQALQKSDDIAQAVGVFRKEVTVDYGNGSMKMAFETMNNASMDTPYIQEGRMPQKNNEVLATSKFLYDTGLQIGDSFNIKEEVSEGEEAAFSLKSYKIVGSCTDPCDVNNPFEAVSYRTSSSTDTVFILASAVNSSIYTSILIKVKGTEQLFCFDNTYKNRVADVKDTLSASLSKKRAEIRTKELKNERKEKIAQEEKDVDAKLDEAADQLAQAESQLNSSLKDLDSAQKQLNEQKAEAEQQIHNGQDEINKNTALLNENKKSLNQAEAAIEEGQKQIASARDELSSQKEELQKQQAALQQLQAQDQTDILASSLLNVKASFSVNGFTFPQEQFDTYQLLYEKAYEQALEIDASNPQIEENDDLQNAREKLKNQLNTVDETTASSIVTLAEGSGINEAVKNYTDNALLKIQTGLQQVEEAEKQLDQKENQLQISQQQYASGLEQFEDAEKQIQSAQEQLNQKRASAYEQLNEGQKKIEDGRAQIQHGQDTLNSNKASYEKNRQKADEQFAQAYDTLEKEIKPAVWYIQDRSSLNGYGNIQSDADSISSIGTVFPIIFLLVAMLISLTAITRMVEEERGIIGTYKSIGYDNHSILKKYVCFVTAAALIGAALGTLFGFIVLPLFIFRVFRIMYLLPLYGFHWLNPQGILGPVIFLAAVNIAAILACSVELKETPASLMRPKAPKAGKRVLLEKIEFIWKHMSFLNKVTVRNLFRYKKRMLMTVLGIAGCMSLLLFGFAIRDSVHDLMPRQYENINRYDILAVSDHSHFEEIYKELDQNKNVKSVYCAMITQVQLQNNSREETDQLVVLKDGADFNNYVHLIDLNGDDVVLHDGDVAITRNMSITLGLQEGNNVTVQLADLQTSQVKVTNIVQNYLGNYVYMTESTYESLFDDYVPNAIYINTAKRCRDPQKFSEQIKDIPGILSSVSTKEMKDTFSSSFQLINAVVLIVILMSAALAFVVLYTLSTTNISEREREIATMKVLGFYDNEVHAYIDKETFILTAIGIVLGMPLGRLLAETLSTVLKLPSIYLEPSLHLLSYVICAGLCIAFAFMVRWVTDRYLNQVDPATALKNVE